MNTTFAIGSLRVRRLLLAKGCKL